MIAAPPAGAAPRRRAPAKRGRATFDQLDPARSGDPNPNPDPDMGGSDAADAADDDAALFSHNLIFRKAILETLDRETARFEDELRDKRDELGEVRASKEDMAVFLAHQLREKARLERQLRAARAALAEEKSAATTKTKDGEALQRRGRELAARNAALTAQVETLTGTLKKTKDVVRGTQLATAAFHADIKVRTLTQARLERDVHDKASQLEATKKRCTEMEQAAQADAVVMQERAGTHAEQRAQIAHMQRQIASMDGALRASAADIAAAEKKFDVAHRRLENADVARKRAEARRDSDAVAIRDAERMCARLEGELDRAEERAKHADRECGVLHNRLGEAEADLKRERARRVELEERAVTSGLAEDGSSARSRALERDLAQCRQTLRARDTALEELHTTLAGERRANKERAAGEREAMAAAAHALEVAGREAAGERGKAEEIRTELQNRIARQQVEEARMRAVLTEISTQHHQLTQNHVLLQKRVSNTDGAVLRSEYAHEQTRRRENTLLDRLKRGLEADEDEERTKLQSELAAIKREHAAVKKELDNMRRAWLTAQSDAAAANERLRVSDAKQGQMNSAAHVAMEAKRNATRDVAKMDYVLSETRVKSDLAQIRLKKATEHAASLAQERMTLQARLDDMSKLLQGRQAEYRAGVNVLKGTIGVLQRQLREKKRTQHDVLKRESDARGRQQLLQEQLARAKEELGTVKAQLFELRAQTGKATRRGGGSAARAVIGQVKGLEAMLLRRRMERMKKMGGGGGSGGGGSGGGGRGSDKSGGKNKKTATSAGRGGGGQQPNGDGKMACRPTESLQLNKALSVGAERLHEIVLLKNKLEVTEKSHRDARRQCKRLTEQLRMNGGAIESIGIANRALRAEVMAASMEQQLMVAFKKIYELTAPAGNPLQLQPNYRYHPEIVVSEELNAVLSETSWLASADGIADAMDGNVLASLCSPTRQ